MAALLALVLCFLASGFPATHPDSRSSSRVRVSGRSVTLELHCQARSLAEALPLDRDLDGRIDEQELALGKDTLAEYVLARYQLFPGTRDGTGGEPDPATALTGRLIELAGRTSDTGEDWIDSRFAFVAPDELEGLTMRVRLFAEENPFHRDEAFLEFQGDLPSRHLFSGEQGQYWHYRPESDRRAGVLADYWKEGLYHIAAGFDHIAFLIALVLAARRLRSVVGVVTAFTVAHSVTLALAALELVHVRSDLVEMAIALSIAYVGALNLIAQRPGSRWVEAFVFGLVHGLGFAGAIREALAFEPMRMTALLGFNLGVECGQLAIVLPLAILFARLPGSRAAGDQPRAFLAPRWLRIGGSALVVVAGLYWFLERTGLFG